MPLSKAEAHLYSLLASKQWRMNNLYYILDKEDNKTLLNLNHSQIEHFKILHPKTITLKSRQQGISTYKVAENLDKCIFTSNTQAGIQSYGQSESKKLSRKAMFMWENMDPDIKDILGIKLTSANQEGFTFSNGSVLKIGNFRGDTLSSLHVSELAKIAARFPEKAEELNTGAFEAVSTNSSISIESTAEGAVGLYYDMWNTAVARLKAVGNAASKLTPLDFYPLFLGWVDDPDCSMPEYYEPTKEDVSYFREVEEYHKQEGRALALTQEQKNWCAAKRARLGDMFNREYPYSPEIAFFQAIEGTYYSREFKNLTIHDNTYDENLLVHSAFDLGMGDTFVIGFFQVHPDKTVKMIGEYSNNGEGLAHYADVYSKLTEKYGWEYGSTYVPHDIKVKELIAGKTRWEALIELGFKPVLVKKHRLAEGIEATRQFLKTLIVDSSCKLSIRAIQTYRKKYDKSVGMFLDSPQHDEASHYADMIRYMAMGHKYQPQTPKRHIQQVYNTGGIDI